MEELSTTARQPACRRLNSARLTQSRRGSKCHGDTMGKGGVEQGCDLCAHEVDLNEPLAVFTGPRADGIKSHGRQRFSIPAPQKTPSGSVLDLLAWSIAKVMDVNGKLQVAVESHLAKPSKFTYCTCQSCIAQCYSLTAHQMTPQALE